MTYKIAPLPKAMTAIAAALAFISAPSFAQNTGATPDTSAETPAVADPLAPEPVAEQAPAAPEAVPPPAPKPKVETTRAKAASAAPAKAAKPARASSSITRPTVRREAAAAPAAPLTEAAAAAPLSATPPPAVAEAAPPPPVAEPAPANGMAGALMAEIMADDRLPYAGGAALGLLALGGAGLVSRRRKRRRENEAFEARQQFLDSAEGEPEPPVLELDRSAEVRPGPAFTRPGTPMHDPVPQRAPAAAAPVADAPTTEIPEGFDLSRFGPHVQAAYRGPTEDNPSLSLKYRLRRGAALDQQARIAAEQAGPARTEAPASVPTRGKWESRPDADFLFRRAGKPVEREVEPS